MDNAYDFSGYATRINVRCDDGRTIMHNAFAGDDGKTVPLVWAHGHSSLDNILGHALLENRPDGVYMYGSFNNSTDGQKAKELVTHRDITKLSIFANELVEDRARGTVSHGSIKEVSLVYAGANPGAFIDNVISHGIEDEEAAVIYFGDEAEIDTIDGNVIEHAAAYERGDAKLKKPSLKPAEDKEDNKSSKEEPSVFNGGKTPQDVIETMNDEQKAVMYGLAQEMLNISDKVEEDDDEDDDDKEDNDNGGKKDMKHNAFEQGAYSGEADNTLALSHELQTDIINDAKRYGSMRDSCLQHGITNVEYLFPEAKADSPVPSWYSRDMGWVTDVMSGVNHSPFSRIKSVFADITEDEARAKGYIKGKLKKEEVFSLLKRSTGPTTVYKKQKMDRDDVVDITGFDVINWIKAEMRVMLNEELARAYLIGDGRLASSDDKIDELCIRPIAMDDSFYTIKGKYTVAPNAPYKERADKIIEALTLLRRDYKGSGNPTAFVNEDLITIMTLAQDLNGRYIYESIDTMARKLRVSKIVSVPVFEGVKGPNGGELMGVFVNLRDYRVGADKGGAINMFDDFDIDYNQQKYLIETRCSGALTVPKSAMVLEEVVED